MQSLTVYIVPNDKPAKANKARLMESFKAMPGGDKVIFESLPGRALHEVKPPTDWYGFLFDLEWLDEKLAAALPVFFEHDFDFLICYKLVVDKGKSRAFVAPRFFKSGVRLIENKLTPENEDSLKWEKILDGWIKEEDRL